MPRILYRCDRCKKLDFVESLPPQEREHLNCGGTWRPLAIPLRAIEMLEAYARRVTELRGACEAAQRLLDAVYPADASIGRTGEISDEEMRLVREAREAIARALQEDK
jgi:hypothetical protein